MKYNFEQHCTEESLELYAMGQLEEPLTEVLEEHILICEGCRGRLDGADAYVRAMNSAAGRLRQEPATESPKSVFANWFGGWDWLRTPSPALAVAAVLGCAAVLVSTQLTHSAVGKAVDVTLVAERGGANPAPRNHILNLSLDGSGLDIPKGARVELVDWKGHMIQSDKVPEIHEKFGFKTKDGLKTGGYFIRVYAPGSDDPAREYALEVK